jgi:hypothetical protein
MKIIVHKNDGLEYYYLIDDNGEVLANTAYADDLFTDTMNDEFARSQRFDLARRRLFNVAMFNVEAFYDDSKECKEFLIELKKKKINEDFNVKP